MNILYSTAQGLQNKTFPCRIFGKTFGRMSLTLFFPNELKNIMLQFA